MTNPHRHFNDNATYFPSDGELTQPTIEIAGLDVVASINEHGELVVNIGISDNVDRRLSTPRNRIPIRVLLNDDTVYSTF